MINGEPEKEEERGGVLKRVYKGKALGSVSKGRAEMGF